MAAAFEDLDRRMGRDPASHPSPDPQWYEVRTRHLLATDPDGAIAADVGGELAGVALAIVREGVWGLSLLVVDPAHQSSGIGRNLLAAACAYGRDAPAGIILSSDDPRAMRAYARAGFALWPSFDAEGPVLRRPALPCGVRPGRWPQDAGIVDAAGRAARGAGYARDVEAYLAAGAELLVDERGGFAINRQGSPALLAAESGAVATDLLRACLRGAPPDATVSVQFITHANQWAIDVALDAGLPLCPAGPVCVRGGVGPLAPLLPSGAFL